MQDTPFAFVDLPAERSQTKPRRAGLTMMADWGLSIGQIEELVGFAGAYVDFAKIVTGTARLYPQAYLQDKLARYKRARIRPFIGGQFVEYVLAIQGRQALLPFFEEARRLGFETVEISDNCVPLSDQERRSIIGQAITSGLSVFGEVGSKDAKSDVAALIRQAGICFEAGAELVLVEAAEIVEAGQIDRDMLAAIARELDMARVMIELPGPWITGVTLSQVDDLKKLLIKELGPDVNLANVKPDDVIATEALRVGLGVVGPSARRAAE